MNVLVIVLNFKRKDNVIRIIEALRNQTVHPKIAVWNNGDQADTFSADYVFSSSANLFPMPRWHIAALLGAEYVCILDDDRIPKERDLLEKCAHRSKQIGDDRIIGYIGKDLSPGPNYYSEGGYIRPFDAEASTAKDVYVDIVLGQFMFMHVSLLRKVHLYCPYYDHRGDDIWISLKTSGGPKFHLLPSFMYGALAVLPSQDVSLSLHSDHGSKRNKMVSDMLLGNEVSWRSAGLADRGSSFLLAARRLARRLKRVVHKK